MIVIVAGTIGRSALGGQAWASMHYLIGLRDLGHDVYYLEDCGEESWVYNWDTEVLTTELDYPANYVRQCLEPLGFGQRWIYRAGHEHRGMGQEEFVDVCREASLLVIRAKPLTCWRPEYDLPRRRIFIDVDPGFTQIKLVENDPELRDTVDRCEHVFTFGQRIGARDCSIPAAGRQWHATLPPVVLSAWPVAPDEATHFTSIMRWRGFIDVEYQGVSFGQKDREFPRFLDLPRESSQPMKMALLGRDIDLLLDHGWEATPGWLATLTPWAYRTFIQNSRAEFGVAKHGYVATKGGWFSDRSVCYLASGRPVLIEDTGLEDWLPVGEGIVIFRDLEEALRGVNAINAEYERHARSARRLAEEIFATDRVLPPLLEAALG